MNIHDALKIIKILADGIDPATGELFEENSPYQHPQVIRALFAAISILEREEVREKRIRLLPANAGKSWTKEEDDGLVAAFNQGVKVNDLARKHERTVGSIESRLVRHGLIEQKTK